MGAVIDLTRWRRQRERRAYHLRGLPLELMETIQIAEMDPRHEHLDALLEQPPEKPKP